MIPARYKLYAPDEDDFKRFLIPRNYPQVGDLVKLKPEHYWTKTLDPNLIGIVVRIGWMAQTRRGEADYLSTGKKPVRVWACNVAWTGQLPAWVSDDPADAVRMAWVNRVSIPK